MRAAVVVAPQIIEITEVQLPEPGPTQIRLKMEGCGLCASNIPVWQGREWFTYPIEAGNPGHEGWGTVDAIGKDVTHVQVGERIAAITYNAYAEYDLAEAESIVKLPASFNGIPFPGEPLGCAINIFKRSGIQVGQTVAIIGIGFLGALLIQLAKNAGAKVIALSQRDFSLKIAQDCGADEIVKLDDHWQIIEKVKNLTGGTFCPRVIECTGKEWPLNLAGELTAERGKLIIAGYHQDGMRAVNVQLWNWRGLDVINAHERDPKIYLQGMHEAVDAVLSGRMNPQPLYTHTFPFENIAEAFQVLQNRPDGFMKALIKF
ncbi:zinc-binding dehydrogenase [Adhaeribacter radiodurans]|uniref:Zinc-binding dehydrogenase n=2 Tax=Adhaeribacter radiodurans TaxID=2745197 RepID=A0A7L7LGB7_9BACT|nr:zinc-binding dehydrogenase [Adhaeribacter radiodurans]